MDRLGWLCSKKDCHPHRLFPVDVPVVDSPVDDTQKEKGPVWGICPIVNEPSFGSVR